MTERSTEGAGPWVFEVPALAAGETWYLDLPNMKYNKTKRYFSKYLPLDQSQVSNESTETVDVEYNGVFTQRVLSNQIETFDNAGVRTVLVENKGSQGIAAGEVAVELVKEPYNADKAARERKERSPVADVIEKFTGVGL